jgi:hypothetical protein
MSEETCQHVHSVSDDETRLCGKPAVEVAPNGKSYCTHHIDVHIHGSWSEYDQGDYSEGNFDEEIEIEDDSE